MKNSFTIDKFPDGVSGPFQQLLNGVKKAVVKMKKAMLQVVPNMMQV